MERETYKVGDKVKFTFIGIEEKGIIKKITEHKNLNFTKYNFKYDISDGKYTYPVSYENILEKI